MAENLISSPAYRVAFSMYVALGGDPNMTFDSVDAVYAAIDELYGKGTRVTIENLSVEITENGGYLYDNEEITGYKPVSVNVSVPQKYTDEQVESLKETARQEGYDSGYDLGVADGFTQGESEGYNDGYAEGLEDGAADQKELLEAVTFTENGTYTKEDGYNQVTVAVEMPEIPTFETEELSIELTENGTYNYTPTKDGYSKVDVTVNVASSGGEGSTGIDLVALGFTAEEQTAYDNSINNLNTAAQTRAQTILDEWTAPNSLSNAYTGLTDLVVFPVVPTRHSSAWQMQNTFKNCTNLKVLGPIGAGTSNSVLYLNSTFENCGNLETAPKVYISESAVSAFKNCFSLKDASAITGTSSGIGASNMFENCVNLETAPAITVSYGDYIFKNCEKLTDISNFKVYFEKLASSRCSTAGMFYGCKSLETLLSTSSSYNYWYRAYNYTEMFYGCEKLNTTTLISIGTSSSSTLPYILDSMFEGCTSLTRPVISTVSSNRGTNYTASRMYYGCTALTKGASFSFSKFKDISYMYQGCTSMTQIADMDCPLIANCSNFAYNCTALTTLGGFTNLGQQASLTGTTSMINRCSALTHDSILNVINGLYDRATAGYSVLTLKLHANTLALLSDEEIAIATNKGWIIS